MRRVTVEWEDSCCTSGWHRPEQVDKTPAVCETTGYLVERTPGHICLALSRGLDTQRCGEFLTIPASAVRKVRYITDKKPQRQRRAR